jgi:glycolate oxidase
MDAKKNSYIPVTIDVIGELTKICGKEAVIFGDDRQLEKYSHDAVSEKQYFHLPEVVVSPSTTEQVSAIMRLANEMKIPVTPRAGGSGLSGGSIPVYGGIVLCVDRMNRIIEIDRANLMAVVEPGVVTNHLDNALKEVGLFFPGYPMSEEVCFIAGNVSENAGGGRAVKYGVTGRYIHGLEIVTPTGDVFQAGGKRIKDVTGYDLIQLMVGSEGTLGIFTKIFIRLLPRPTHRKGLLVLTDDVNKAVEMISQVMVEGRLIPSAVEFMDGFCFALAARDLKHDFPYEQTRVALLFEVDGRHVDEVDREAKIIEDICRQNEVVGIYTADTESELEAFWKIRKRVIWVLRRHFPRESVEDIALPIAALADIISELESIGEKYKVHIPIYGHAADGNLHATPAKNPQQSDSEWEAMLPEILADIYRAVARLGGTISGEHGIGHKRRDFLELVMSPVQIDLMRRIKKAIDPNNILNPGKIISVHP